MFPYRSLPRTERLIRALCRQRCFHSTTTSLESLVHLSTDSTTGVAVLTMNNPPANSLSLDMLNSMSRAIATAEEDQAVQSLVIKSTHPTIFSAGLELRELYQPQQERIRSFWAAFQQLYLDLYGSRLACIAAIQGHAPAAGCMLALSCDYRIMASSSSIRIGLNESLLGIVAPPWLAQQYMDTVGIRTAEKALSLGTLYGPEEALRIGLVDELVDDSEQTFPRARETAEEWARIPPVARVANKQLVRKERIDQMRACREQDTEDFCQFVVREDVQAGLGAYSEKLESKKKRP